MKRILYLSFYFEPDLCAGSFRNTPLAKELARLVRNVAEVDVITTIPNRYKSFSVDSSEIQQIENLSITRIMMPLHKSGFIDQANLFRHFYFATKKISRGKKYDLVFASSSRLFTAYLGYELAKEMKVPLYLDIRDIFTDTMNEVITNRMIKKVVLPSLLHIERKTFNYASHINLISEGFRPYFEKYLKAKYSYFTNGIDEEFVFRDNFSEALHPTVKTITYAGNIGEGQGLHKIIPQAAEALGKEYRFLIIGDGGARRLLEEEINKRRLSNIKIERPVKRNELIEIYKGSHFLMLHLNDYKAFEKVLPSKIFELGAFPRPILAGVSGYARLFMEKNISDLILFQPAHPEDLVQKLKLYQYSIPKRNEFIHRFGRDQINLEMAKSIISYL